MVQFSGSTAVHLDTWNVQFQENTILYGPICGEVCTAKLSVLVVFQVLIVVFIIHLKENTSMVHFVGNYALLGLHWLTPGWVPVGLQVHDVIVVGLSCGMSGKESRHILSGKLAKISLWNIHIGEMRFQSVSTPEWSRCCCVFLYVCWGWEWGMHECITYSPDGVLMYSNSWKVVGQCVNNACSAKAIIEVCTSHAKCATSMELLTSSYA